MDWLTFISEIVKSIAWPAVVAIAVALLRQPLADLIPLLRRFSYKGLKLDFAKEVEQVKEEAAAILPDAAETLPEEATLGDRLIALASASPRAAVIETWREVESSAKRALEDAGVDLSRKKWNPPLRFGHLLQKSEILAPDQVSLYNELRVLRNKATHADESNISELGAVDYIFMGLSLHRCLNEGANKSLQGTRGQAARP